MKEIFQILLLLFLCTSSIYSQKQSPYELRVVPVRIDIGYVNSIVLYDSLEQRPLDSLIGITGKVELLDYYIKDIDSIAILSKTTMGGYAEITYRRYFRSPQTKQFESRRISVLRWSIEDGVSPFNSYTNELLKDYRPTDATYRINFRLKDLFTFTFDQDFNFHRKTGDPVYRRRRVDVRDSDLIEYNPTYNSYRLKY